MNTILIILSAIGGFVVVVISFFATISYLYEKKEEKDIKKAVESFDYVARNINGCQYWLNSPEQKPFRDFFVFMVEEMKNNHHLSCQAVRDKVNEIISVTPKNK